MRKRFLLPMALTFSGLLLSCSSNSVEGLLYAPTPVEAASKVSDSSRAVYMNFAKTVAPAFFDEVGGDGNSACLSIPDLFLCCNMMAILSEEPAQEAYLNAVGASSIEDLAEASKELISVFCYVDKDEDSESGAFNLNGLFFSPALKLLDDAESRFETIADSFNGYVFRSAPTTEIVDSWIRDADKDGYLAEVPTPEIGEGAVVSTVSAYAVIDAFESDIVKAREKTYEEGGNRLEYTLLDGTKKLVDCLWFTNNNSAVERGSNYVSAGGSINSCFIRAYVPDEGVGLPELADSIFSSEEKTYEYYSEVSLNIPMFDVETSFDSHPSDLVPSFSNGVGTGFFEKDSALAYEAIFSQNNKLKLDYNGFKGASITVGTVESTSPSPDETTVFELEVDKPFIFQVSKSGLPLYYGMINDPGYPLAN